MTDLPSQADTPEVSVVMSVYNATSYLHASMQSILEQQGVRLEFVIVNDGSNDNAPAILEEYARKDTRIRLIHQKNQGLTRALVRCCQEARAPFIARQDGDDYSLPGRLAKQAALLRGDPGLVMVSSWADVLGPRDEVLLTLRRDANSVKATWALLHEREGPPGHGSVMFRKDAYERAGGYRPEFYFTQDSDLWLRMVRIGRVAYVQEALYQYRVNAESISGELHHLKVPYAELVEEVRRAAIENRSDEHVLEKARALPSGSPNGGRQGSRDTTLYFIGKCLYDRLDRRCARYFVDAIRVNPLRLNAWFYLTLSLSLLLRSRGNRSSCEFFS